MKDILAFTFFFFLCAGAWPGQAFADDLETMVVATDFPPYSIVDKPGSSSGIGVEIMQEIAKRLSLSVRRVQLPASQIDTMSKNELAIFVAVTRTDARESRYRWVGKLTDDHYCLAMQKSGKSVSTIESARELKAIGVNQSSGTEAAMDRLGLKNKSLAANNSGNVKKLFAGRIDAWFAPASIVSDSIRREKLDPEKIQCLGDFGKSSYWIAASPKIDNALYEKLKATFSLIEKEGLLDSIFARNGLPDQRARP